MPVARGGAGCIAVARGGADCIAVARDCGVAEGSGQHLLDALTTETSYTEA